MLPNEGSSYFLFTPADASEPCAIHYEVFGKGKENVLLVHGLGGYSFSFRHLIPRLVQEGYRVWSLDLLGFGRSSKPGDVAYNLKLYEKTIAEFVSFAKIAPFHFVGHSMGGGLGILFASQKHYCPVKTLTLISPTGYPLRIPVWFFKPLSLATKFGPRLLKLGVRLILRLMVYDKRHITEDMVQAYMAPIARKHGSRALFSLLKSFHRAALRPFKDHIARLSVPTLVVWGKNDRLLSSRHAKKFRKTLPNASVHILPQCGHLPPEEKPHETLELLIPFLADADGFIAMESASIGKTGSRS